MNFVLVDDKCIRNMPFIFNQSCEHTSYTAAGTDFFPCRNIEKLVNLQESGTDSAK